MPICGKCKKQFHACSSCGLYHDWEYKYCNYGCWTSSEEYLTDWKVFKDLWDSLNDDQRKYLKIILEDWSDDQISGYLENLNRK